LDIALQHVSDNMLKINASKYYSKQT